MTTFLQFIAILAIVCVGNPTNGTEPTTPTTTPTMPTTTPTAAATTTTTTTTSTMSTATPTATPPATPSSTTTATTPPTPTTTPTTTTTETYEPYGPTEPTAPYYWKCSSEGDKIVDKENMCWYHECTATEYGLEYLPKECEIGYRISYDYLKGQTNPCTIHAQDNENRLYCKRTQASTNKMGPTGPTTPYYWKCFSKGDKIVDKENMCWYHECTATEYGLQYLPKKCEMGWKISYNYMKGQTNPCTIHVYDNYNEYGNTCNRTQASINNLVLCNETFCDHGGTPIYESDYCVCDCHYSWNGNQDCSRPTQDLVDFWPGDNICLHDWPEEDWCQNVGGCLNGGSCYNNCDTYFCECPDWENISYNGTRCEL